MRVLIACEESQRVCCAFRERGHEAFSCDVVEPSGDHPEWHIKSDVLPLLNGDCTFETLDTHTHTQVGRWDMIIAFPPCTDLAVSGARWFERKRKDGRLRLRNRRSIPLLLGMTFQNGIPIWQKDMDFLLNRHKQFSHTNSDILHERQLASG